MFEHVFLLSSHLTDKVARCKNWLKSFSLRFLKTMLHCFELHCFDSSMPSWFEICCWMPICYPISQAFIFSLSPAFRHFSMTSLWIICAELSPLTGNSGPVVLEILQMYFFGEDIISVPMFSFSGAPFISKLNLLYQSSTFLTFFSPFSNLWLIGSYILSDMEFLSFIILCFCLVSFPGSPFLLVFVTGGHGEQGQVFVSVPHVSETLSQH